MTTAETEQRTEKPDRSHDSAGLALLLSREIEAINLIATLIQLGEKDGIVEQLDRVRDRLDEIQKLLRRTPSPSAGSAE